MHIHNVPDIRNILHIAYTATDPSRTSYHYSTAKHNGESQLDQLLHGLCRVSEMLFAEVEMVALAAKSDGRHQGRWPTGKYLHIADVLCLKTLEYLQQKVGKCKDGVVRALKNKGTTIIGKVNTWVYDKYKKATIGIEEHCKERCLTTSRRD